MRPWAQSSAKTREGKKGFGEGRCCSAALALTGTENPPCGEMLGSSKKGQISNKEDTDSYMGS
jgi:hypothetical protein